MHVHTRIPNFEGLRSVSSMDDHSKGFQSLCNQPAVTSEDARAHGAHGEPSRASKLNVSGHHRIVCCHEVLIQFYTPCASVHVSTGCDRKVQWFLVVQS